MENLINKNISILLVDDEPFILNLTSKILNNLGYENLKTAQDGNSALLKLVTSNSPFDLIICDMNMPEMDGITMLKRLHNDFSLPEANIVMLTTEATKELKTQARENGAKAWVLKPVSEDKVNMIFKKLL